ncbi:MAG: FAD-dependent oxidoreductase [Bacteroidales bacterium]|nr:FAD-dependent oxidoreductase [Bacteroidales bacterium]
MDRKKFIELCTVCGGAFATTSVTGFPETILASAKKNSSTSNEDRLSSDLVIAGGGLGGCAAALAALRNNLTVILTEETDWIGGQIAQQGVPPDEHQWIETHGSTQLYRQFRNSVRQYYVRNYPLTDTARENKFLNPGDGSVSRLCHEPRTALAVLIDFLAPYISSGKLVLLTNYKIISADVNASKVRALKAVNQIHGKNVILSAPYFVDATELGDLLPLTGTEFVTGSESKKETGELHAPEKANPENNQAFTYCFALDYIPGENHLIEKPHEYDFWRNYKPELDSPWSGKLLDLSYSNPSTLAPKSLGFNPEGVDTSPLLNLWNYRRIINKNNFKSGTYRSDITIVNWPQNDYLPGNLIGASQADFSKHIESAKQLSLSLLYWLQTEAPRPDKGYGWPGLRLRRDIMGTEDGLAKYPYIRESRRIKAEFTILEEHVGKENRSMVTGKKDNITASEFYDSIGIGYYHIDLHPSCAGNNYIDIDSLPFQIPLGALIPKRIQNLIPANKNIGTTHITNGCYRVHPVEWSIGESAGLLIAFSKSKKVLPREVRERKELLAEFQDLIRTQGIETHWPK